MYDRDRILQAVDLTALADELLGQHSGTGRSQTWPCPSPTHAQTGRTPPVSVFRSHQGDERWHCHGCGEGGTASDLVIATRSVDVRAALEFLAGRVGVRDHPDPSAARGPARRHHRPLAREVLTDPEGLRSYVDACAQRLWTPEGRAVRRWLTEQRGIPDEVLRVNRIGADPGRQRQPRPRGMPSAGWSVVLPVCEEGRPVFAQLRLLSSGPMRYLNASAELGPNPRLGLYEPAGEARPCTLITEGVIDALSAASAGYRGAALLGAAIPDSSSTIPGVERLVERMEALPGRLVSALDADTAGDLGSQRLRKLSFARERDMARLHLPDGANDLNDWMRHSADWGLELGAELRTVLSCSQRSARALTR